MALDGVAGDVNNVTYETIETDQDFSYEPGSDGDGLTTAVIEDNEDLADAVPPTDIKDSR